jgi:hypothetical protein
VGATRRTWSSLLWTRGTPCLSHVLRTFCDSWVETLCDSLFESCPGGPSVIPCVSLGLKPSVIPCLSHPSVSLVLKPSVIPSVSQSRVDPFGIPCLSLALKLYVILSMLSQVLQETYCHYFCESWVETLCDSLFESCPRGPSVIPCLRPKMQRASVLSKSYC